MTVRCSVLSIFSTRSPPIRPYCRPSTRQRSVGDWLTPWKPGPPRRPTRGAQSQSHHPRLNRTVRAARPSRRHPRRQGHRPPCRTRYHMRMGLRALGHVRTTDHGTRCLRTRTSLCPSARPTALSKHALEASNTRPQRQPYMTQTALCLLRRTAHLYRSGRMTSRCRIMRNTPLELWMPPLQKDKFHIARPHDHRAAQRQDRP
mmetsp:Transcript_16141/g.43778  ORF Transcript_16141/g.43778 Transcript_16141/m.43778 type:complete len:203 (+) Transcript_16141:4409-5017(+)